MAYESRESGGVLEGICDEMIMIWKDGPGFELPLVEGGKFEERFAEICESFGRVKERLFLVGSGGDDICAASVQAMGWAVRPVRHRWSLYL